MFVVDFSWLFNNWVFCKSDEAWNSDALGRHVRIDLAVQVQSAPAQASSQRHVGFGKDTRVLRQGLVFVMSSKQLCYDATSKSGCNGVTKKMAYLQPRRDAQDLKEPSPSGSGHKATRKGAACIWAWGLEWSCFARSLSGQRSLRGFAGTCFPINLKGFCHLSLYWCV